MMRKMPGLLKAYGVEIEYMIVRAGSLDVLPASDEVLKKLTGRYANDAEIGPLGLSNEFVLHVLEMKNTDPVSGLSGLGKLFDEGVSVLNGLLEPMGARLMPAAMHPWMDPAKETRLWPHGYARVYRTYDRIFNCSRHGWANIQSMQLNISFGDEAGFASLHSAARFLLPIIPALAASSPIVEGKVTGLLDSRLLWYRDNQRIAPSITGAVVPEPVYSYAGYRQEVLERMYREMANYDPEGILRHEWLNSRGAIPKFERKALEIRLPDMQECPTADMAVAAAMVSVIRALVTGRWSDAGEISRWGVEPLVKLLEETIRSGERAVIDDAAYLKCLAFPGKKALASELWRHLAEATIKAEDLDAVTAEALDVILEQGTLATRILRALGKNPSHGCIKEVYGRLCDCLAGGVSFLP